MTVARFADWREAHAHAVRLARHLGREVGIERMEEFGRDGFNIIHLPRPENRCGFELRCEVVAPGDPL